MKVLDRIVAHLKLDATMQSLTPGGIWTGRAPAAPPMGPDSEPPGEQLEDYLVITPIGNVPRRSSSSNHDQSLLQFTAHCHDRGDGSDALAAARAIIQRVRFLLLEAEPILFTQDTPVVGISISSQNYVQDADLNWLGQLDLAFRTQESRVFS